MLIFGFIPIWWWLIIGMPTVAMILNGLDRSI